jgi:Cytochrome c553
MYKLLKLAALLSALAPSVLAAQNDIDLRNGKDVNEVCAGCHGEFGQGGKDGEYPRIAGQPMAYIVKQMHLFRDRKLDNMAMLEYVNPRDFPEADVYDVSAYIAQIELLTQLPPIDESKEFDPLARLQLAKRLLNIPRTEQGDAEKGRVAYNKECRSCHGTDGWGKKTDGEIPMLAGQHTKYLLRQVEKYRQGLRKHDESDPVELLTLFTDAELLDIFAFLATADDIQ